MVFHMYAAGPLVPFIRFKVNIRLYISKIMPVSICKVVFG